MAQLAAARYGKDNVRVCKVTRDPATGVHTVTEMTVRCLLEGAIETSFTEADNSVVVATDSMKNTIYIKARQQPVNPPELFAASLGQHFLDTYPHVSTAHIRIAVHRWTRIAVDGRPHQHSFLRDGEDMRTADVDVDRKAGITVRSGIEGLSVFKSTGSAFHGFARDEWTTLPETWDRILSTDVDAQWRWKPFRSLAAVQAAANAAKFDSTWEAARNIILRTFSLDNSASVQATMFRISDQILAKAPDIEQVNFSLPNKHYLECDLSWHRGLKNTGKDAEVYIPGAGPYGLITCEVTRKEHAPAVPGRAATVVQGA